MFTADLHNNVRRMCSVRGDLSGRKWKIRAAVTGNRYLVVNVDTRQYRTVAHAALSSLY